MSTIIILKFTLFNIREKLRYMYINMFNFDELC